VVERPRFYHLTDGQPPQAPAGNDYEPRPSLFTLDPPVYVQPPPTVVTQQTVTTTTTKAPSKKKAVKAAVYNVRTRVSRAPNGTLTLYITFKLRRAVRIGAEALHGRKVVSSTGIKRFAGKQGELALKLDPRRWPTSIKFVNPTQRRA
jgi:hypothetical protein